jgi:small-conductance mechanosensitive channel
VVNSTVTSIKTLGSSFWQQTLILAPQVATAIVLFILFFTAAKLSKWLLQKSFHKLKHDHAVQRLITQTIQATIIIVGLVTALGTAGVNVSALVASLGLMSFTIGFAFKDLLTNTLAGVLILIYRPFKVGDDISGTNFSGQVRSINLRYVQLEKEDQSVLVPTATLLTTVVNVKKTPHS